MRRPELMPLAVGVIALAYPLRIMPRGGVIYLLPYAILTLVSLRRKAFFYGASSLAGWSFLEWFLTGNYLALVGLIMALVVMPLSFESQPVRRWERALNVFLAGAIAYVSIPFAPLPFRLLGILATVSMLSGNRVVSSGGVLIGSALLMAVPLAHIGDMEPAIFFGASLLLVGCSLHHLRKLLR
ncbi:hypothetical protein [Thermococcus sp.]|uniref:hypothetical protein n=1 Tax=Thermococcus sp. TaxID=35749 RepID=UPI00261EF6C8|nr:hypothetical protein [Thermococcus sp.]